MQSLIYIHGFNSSARGIKAQQLKNIMLDLGAINHFRAPNLLSYPSQAIVQLEALILQLEKPTLVGSSLGGYYATYLAEKYHLKALLVNPIVLPHKIFGKPFNPKENWRDYSLSTYDDVRYLLNDDYEPSFIDDYLAELVKLEIAPPNDKERYKVWLKKADELVDYRFAEEWYKNTDLIVDEGGEHTFLDFGEHFLTILDWAGLK